MRIPLQEIPLETAKLAELENNGYGVALILPKKCSVLVTLHFL
jgi:hypothetical protein